MTKLNVSDDLKLPSDTVTATIVVYGGKGMGKTVFGAVLAEELSRAGHRFSILDPVGRSWGLRYAANGKSPGVEILILGGPHGDIPIEPTGGAVVADLVADEDVDTLIDISRRPNGEGWSNGEKIRFVTDYCNRLYARQQIRLRPIMQIFDEAGRFVPQSIPKGAADIAFCTGAIEQLVELGRNAGIGVCLITQRSARINKSVAELAECMIAFRTIGPNSMAAVLDWLGEHVEKERWKHLIERLRTLDKGEAIIVSPGWIKYEGVAKFRMRWTFDSSATPKAGERHRTTGQGATPDLGKYQQRMVETIERAKAEDPKELRKQIVDLKRQLAQKPTAALSPTAKQPKRVEVSVLKDGQLKKADAIADKLCDLLERNRKLQEQSAAMGEKLANACSALSHAIARVDPKASAELDGHIAAITKRAQAEGLLPKPKPSVGQQIIGRLTQLRDTLKAGVPLEKRFPVRARDKSEADNGAASDELRITRAQQRILDALAFYESLGNDKPTNIQVGAVALMDSTGGYFSNTVGPLSSAGLIVREVGHMQLTDAGRALAQPMESVGSLADYHDVLRRRVRKMKSASNKTIAMLDAIIAEGGADLTAKQLGEAVGIDHTGGYFSNTIGPLGTVGLIRRNRGTITPTEILFPKGLPA